MRIMHIMLVIMNDNNDNNNNTPGLHNEIPAQNIFARVWVAQESLFLQVVAKIFQGLGPKRRESSNGDQSPVKDKRASSSSSSSSSSSNQRSNTTSSHCCYHSSPCTRVYRKESASSQHEGYERQESLQTIADRYFNVEVRIRNSLQIRLCVACSV